MFDLWLHVSCDPLQAVHEIVTVSTTFNMTTVWSSMPVIDGKLQIDHNIGQETTVRLGVC